MNSLTQSKQFWHNATNNLRIGRAVKIAWESGKSWTITQIVLVIIMGVLPLLALYLMKLIVDTLTIGIRTLDKSAVFEQVLIYICLAGGVALLMAICRQISGFVREAQSLSVTDHVYNILHAKSLELDLEYYEDARYFDILHRAQREGPFRVIRLLSGLLQFGQSGTALLAMVGLLFTFHWVFALVLFIAALPGVLVRLKFSNRMYDWQREQTQEERKANYFSWILTGDIYAKEVRLFNLGDELKRRFNFIKNKIRKEKLSLSRKRSLAESSAQAFSIVLVFGTFGLIAYRTVNGIITLGEMVMFFQAFQRGKTYIHEVLGGLAAIYEDNLYFSNFCHFLDLQPKIEEPLKPLTVPQPMQKGFQFDQVWFKYPNSTRPILQNITLSVAPGEIVALVGENGSGKTTLVKLLCRLYDPLNGSIKLDGIDLRQFKADELRQEISIIFQDFVHYHLTVGENIWIGNTALPLNPKSLATAARKAGAHEVIGKLPGGYDTLLGKMFSDGEELSIGEWQKIALARAFFRDSQIIVMDEPTSSLDAKSEYEVFDNFRHFINGRSALLISHRFSTVRMADRIYVFNSGRIIESGTHEQLMNIGGRYAFYFEKQAQFYR